LIDYFWWWLVNIIWSNDYNWTEFYLDIHTQSNLSEIEIVSLVQELIPRYRLRADTDFACSNEDFIQTPRIDGSDFEPLTHTQIRALLDYYGRRIFLPILKIWISFLASSSNRISQMTKTYHDINAVTRMLEDRENDLQMAVSLGQTLLESNDSLRNQVTLLEQDIEQTTEIVKQLKHDLILKERMIRFYTDMDLDLSATESK
jgi:trafficking kinesin-binding protein 1